MTAPISQEEWERQRRASIGSVPAMADETGVEVGGQRWTNLLDLTHAAP